LIADSWKLVITT